MSEKQSYRDSDDMPTERAVLEREWKAMRLALSMPRTPIRVDLIQCLKCQQFWTGPVDGECPHCNPIRAAVQAAQPEAVGLSEEQIKRHSILAADCPGASAVILVSSLRRLLASAPTPEPMSAPTEAKPAPAPGYCKHCKQYTIEEPLPAQQDAAEAVALSPEQEEWVMDLAQKHNLGRRVGQIGTLQGVSPDVFYTDASYRTQELFDFAAELLASSELNADQRRALVGNWFAEDWAVHQALGLLDDYDTERAAISAKKGQP